MRYRTDLIKKPLGTDDVRFPNGNTKNIIETVLYADGKAGDYTKLFAPTLKGPSVRDTCRNIWWFIKSQIQYSLDPNGQQLIKSPGKLWAENRQGLPNPTGGDCKSFSVFAASCLKNLNIPYGYRFASYDKDNSTPTHVYCFVPLVNGGEIIIDAVWDGAFNTQKSFAHKQDYIMKSGEAIGNVTNNKKSPGFLQYK